MKIAIIEDNPKIASFIEKGLTEEKYITQLSANGIEGIEACLNNDIDLLVLDLMLPDISGFDVIKNLRSKKFNSPILILSAKNSLDDKIHGLDIGADDYLVKPFSFEEFLARIRALLRRKEQPTSNNLKAGDIEIDLIKHSVTRQTKVIDLTTKEYLLMEYFLRNPERVLTRTNILENVWDMNFDSDTNIVDVFIRYLRKKIEEPFQSQVIHTIRGAGYQFKPIS